ncbi:DNA (Cytosine-5)-methyltransferase DRM1/2 isoform 2 [Hibiscus syriacus]|uniref:DNA (Cytosine-5)-methyltransferase DRM1/2 isoform 2 n=1 Tax=Hibiscus syriacus TaxID=106335 RepID=A0A6A2ZN62_HIBSY|nr:DNA (Cytosine-5)-methyltransferase DRM1/2 isoform 2 [Hibiscus syriacus]
MERCGLDLSIAELTNFICAAQMAKASDALLPRKLEKKLHNEDDHAVYLLNLTIGFGVPIEPDQITQRTFPEDTIGTSYIYYENVVLAPVGVWTEISWYLYDVEPKFVDSKYSCAAARKRGYIHNLPIENIFPLIPLPPRTIHDALPLIKIWWPSWDPRTKLNYLQTCTGSAKLIERIRKALEAYDDEPPLSVQKYVLDECRKWNLVWVGRSKVVPLEPDEVEMLLGFPKNHTRGGSARDIFTGGINVLSFFSGISDAGVAFYCLGIPLKKDTQELNGDRLEQLMSRFSEFDLVVGDIQCNNLTGRNKHHRDELEDFCWCIFLQ